MPSTARNEDWTDREILGIIDDLDQGDGVTSSDIGRAMGFATSRKKDEKNKTPATAVGSRLGYMRDLGLLKSYVPTAETWTEPGDRDRRWELTGEGRTVLNGKLTKTASEALRKMASGDRILAVKQLMNDGWVEGDDATAFAMDRQIKHDRARRRRRVR